MMRALYTSATGMMAQQMNMDVVANNLANVNTTGFKRSRADFEDLLYQEMRPAGSVVAQGATAPTGIEVGLGVKAGATVTMFEQGTFQNTGQSLDIAIEGDGFYKVLLPDGGSGYTRDGAFKRDNQGKVVNSDGMALQPEITIPDGATSVSIGKDGTVNATIAGVASPIGKITLTRFPNPAGLSHIGGNNFKASDASGTAVDGTPGQEGFGTIAQGMLEMSNVQIVQEMVNMITAQRAYETNSKSIQTADEMLSTANQLKH
ncbi:MAG: flgG [Capsulimonas sp.]|jgi:flagellar basal-body rod protein FlgG|nr:flgG [Capsulimonas sp.]